RPRLYSGRKQFGSRRHLLPARPSRDPRPSLLGLEKGLLCVREERIDSSRRSRRPRSSREPAATPARSPQRHVGGQFTTRWRHAIVITSPLSVSTRRTTQQEKSRNQAGFLVVCHRAEELRSRLG